MLIATGFEPAVYTNSTTGTLFELVEEIGFEPINPFHRIHWLATSCLTVQPLFPFINTGACGGIRTLMLLEAVDFKSTVYTCSTTHARDATIYVDVATGIEPVSFKVMSLALYRLSYATPGTLGRSQTRITRGRSSMLYSLSYKGVFNKK